MIGHNSEGIESQSLPRLIARIERLNEEKAALTADISEVFKEAKSQGFDVKVMRKVIAERKLDAAERAERDALIETYMSALGDLVDSPLGQAALGRVA